MCALWNWAADTASGCCCQSGVCALELGCWCSCRVLLQGAPAACCLRVQPFRMVSALWRWLAGGCKVPRALSECCARFGAGG